MGKKTACVDLDGTLAKPLPIFNIELFGDPQPGAVAFMQELHKHADIIIYTCRCSADMYPKTAPNLLIRPVRQWLEQWGIPYDKIYTEAGKPVADVYFDDRAVNLQGHHRNLRTDQEKIDDYARALEEALQLFQPSRKKFSSTGEFLESKS